MLEICREPKWSHGTEPEPTSSSFSELYGGTGILERHAESRGVGHETFFLLTSRTYRVFTEQAYELSGLSAQ